MTEFFPNINHIKYEGPQTKNPLAYRYYNPQQQVLNKTMEEHLRMAVCFWHTFCWSGQDIFGEATFDRPWLQAADPMQRAEQRVLAAFEFISKLGLPFFTFHDRDVAPEGNNLQESNRNLQHIAEKIAAQMQKTGIKLLWGTANLFSHRRYMAGAATNPNPEVFAYAVAQVKQALDITHQLKGANYVLWGGREGYDTLLNTDLRQESEQLGRFLSLLVDYKHKIGFKGTFLIEPKPCEPTKHQYDFDSATVLAFLQKYGLEKEFKVNIEANHATLSGHSFPHEIAYAYTNGIFGSIDANRGDAQLGWDTDQFPMDLNDTTLALYYILQHGGFENGGFNFDTKLRRQSIDLEDMFYAHISGVDTLARSLLVAAKLITSGELQNFVNQRYAGWKSGLGAEILGGKADFERIAAEVLKQGLEPKPVSGHQELLESIVNEAI
ncbi:MAG TPA: xylose isomerase [Gammaproteobacteria bacterium]|nr:xylose isomerase [Gammaproteobacteria bacterium]